MMQCTQANEPAFSEHGIWGFSFSKLNPVQDYAGVVFVEKFSRMEARPAEPEQCFSKPPQSVWQTSTLYPEADEAKTFLGSSAGSKINPTYLLHLGYFRAQERIAAFSKLKENWDSHGSLPPNEVAVRNGLRALQALREIGLAPTRVNPSCDEGILFEVDGEKDERIVLDFYNSGEIVLLRKGAQGRSVSEVPSEALERRIKELR